jgi:hypothetical protein
MIWPTAMLEELSRERERLLAQIALADDAIRSDQCSSHELRQQVLRLHNALSEYTDLEDERMPLLLGALDDWGRDEVGAMLAEHEDRRAAIASAMAEIDALGTYEQPGDVYGMTDALVHLRSSVLAALDVEEALLRNAASRTDDMNYDGSGGRPFALRDLHDPPVDPEYIAWNEAFRTRTRGERDRRRADLQDLGDLRLVLLRSVAERDRRARARGAGGAGGARIAVKRASAGAHESTTRVQREPTALSVLVGLYAVVRMPLCATPRND